MHARVIAEIERPTPMREPAHDHLVRRDHLLPIDAEVLPLLERTARDGESPRDERSRVAGPACLDRQARKIDLIALPHGLLARGGVPTLRRHVEHLHEHGARVLPCIPEALRRLRFLQEGEQPTDLAQALVPVGGIGAHRERDALRRPEQVAQHRDRRAAGRDECSLRPLEQDRRTGAFQRPVADLGHLEARIDLDADAPKFAA
jgi:hypothetical protein